MPPMPPFSAAEVIKSNRMTAFRKRSRCMSSSKIADRICISQHGVPDMSSSKLADQMRGHPKWSTGCHVIQDGRPDVTSEG